MNSSLTFRIPALAFAALGLAACSTVAASDTLGGSTAASTAATIQAEIATVPVSITGGHDTEADDNGRPVVLVAALLGVDPDVFRDAFSGVTPARDAEPEADQVLANKQALLSVLGPYGVTNDALDQASNTYRYLASAGETWRQSSAIATATVIDGTVTHIAVADGGSGYTSAPTVTITLPDGSVLEAHATVAYTSDVATNGSITAISLDA